MRRPLLLIFHSDQLREISMSISSLQNPKGFTPLDELDKTKIQKTQIPERKS